MPFSVEERIGEEDELQRSDRALDRHLDDVDDELAAFPEPQRVGQGLRTLEGVEVVDRLAVLGSVEARGLVGADRVPVAMTRKS